MSEGIRILEPQAGGLKLLERGFLADLAEVIFVGLPSFCLQCFDAVGWAAGRASGL